MMVVPARIGPCGPVITRSGGRQIRCSEEQGWTSTKAKPDHAFRFRGITFVPLPLIMRCALWMAAGWREMAFR